MEKCKVAIIGSGNIGTDLLIKLQRSLLLEVVTMVRIDPQSAGLQKAKELGCEIIDNGLPGYLDRTDIADIIFDATSAKAHLIHAELLKKTGSKVIDLTPAAVGPFVVPVVNSRMLEADNVNLITCGGQATIPLIHAVSCVVPVKYAEIVATISSKSAGPGTRANIDEFTLTTKRGIEEVGGAERGKAIIILNPAEPPILMRDTIYLLVEGGTANKELIIDSIEGMTKIVQSYVPGYRLKAPPIFEEDKIIISIEVEGAGDFLPNYAGNLDIMTAAAVKVAEEMSVKRIQI